MGPKERRQTDQDRPGRTEGSDQGRGPPSGDGTWAGISPSGAPPLLLQMRILFGVPGSLNFMDQSHIRHLTEDALWVTNFLFQ